MKIVIAPDSFKESMTALEAADAIESGFKKVLPNAEYIKIPMADGGEGTVQSLVDATGGEVIQQQVTGPLGKPVNAFYGITGDGKTGIIEMAAASGLHLLKKEERNPLLTTTKGTGELILAALDANVEHLIIGLGGSATNDGGAGMAQALGVKLLNAQGVEINHGGGELKYLDTIDMTQIDDRINNIMIEVACDVDNPLTGRQGATAVFGPQKGATDSMVETLDDNLSHYAQIIMRDITEDVDQVAGAGAAGGLGAGLIAFSNAEIKRGVDIVIDAVNLEKAIQGACLVITGEGKIDIQTSSGKTPMGVAQVAKKYNIPVIGIAGLVDHNKDDSLLNKDGLDAVFSIAPGPVKLEDAMRNAPYYAEKTAENIAQLMKITRTHI